MISIIVSGQEILVENIESLGFRTKFTDFMSEQELNVDSLVIVGSQSKSIIDNHIATYGYHVGIPSQIVYGTMTYDYYLDIRGMIHSDKYEVKIKKRKGTDSFVEMARATYFEDLARAGYVFPTINVPYVIVKDNQLELGVTLAISTFLMIQTAQQAIKDTAILAAEFTASLGSLNPALIAGASAKLIFQLAYDAVIIVALADLVKQLRELIFPKIRYFKACKIVDLIRVSCEAKGYTFTSSFLDSLTGLTILPIPIQKTNPNIFNFLPENLNQSFTKGYPTAQDTTPTLLSVIDEVMKMFKVKTKSVNESVQIETKETFKKNASFSVIPQLNLQDRREDSFTVNTGDANIRDYIHYQTDFNDIHTVNNFEPTDAEYGSKNVNQLDADLNLLSGLNDVTINYALGVRKSKLNFVENIAYNVLSTIDELVGTSFASSIENRLGVLQVSQQFYSITKLLYVDVNGKQPSNYLSYIKASALWNNYHKQYTIQNNGFKIFENAPVPMNFDEYSQILNSNYANVNDIKCEITEVLHIPEGVTEISYLEPYNYANGKIVNFVINE